MKKCGYHGYLQRRNDKAVECMAPSQGKTPLFTLFLCEEMLLPWIPEKGGPKNERVRK